MAIATDSYYDQVSDFQTSIVGDKLNELTDEINQLFGALNFLDVDESEQDQLETDLDALGRVRDLVRIAAELYPYGG